MVIVTFIYNPARGFLEDKRVKEEVEPLSSEFLLRGGQPMPDLLTGPVHAPASWR